MAKKTSGRGGFLVAGLGFGVAVGVLAGALVIAPATHSGGEALTGSRAELEQAQREAEISEAQAKTADAVVAELGRASIEGVLADRPVLLVRTADARDEDADAVSDLLRKAKATDAGRITLTGKFTAQDGADELKTIVTNTLPAGAQLSEDHLDPGTHFGEALGSALMLARDSGKSQASEEERATLLETLAQAGFVQYEKETIRPAQVMVVVSGGSEGAGEEGFSAQVVSNFVQAVQTRGNGVVLAGLVGSAADTGAIGLTRQAVPAGERGVSTVDSVDRDFGRIATVLAAREQLDGDSGAYGAAASAEAATPPVPKKES